ncbi:uncharacterized protein B0H64DRAFT_29587 [Chaetomium fimeti]|uniref:Uncharacterized protein n=1 Tax=Chaetomium fimeti TaxID=1854472 RepID=A0AAE0HSM2_9PEZI|nr:hypothetical protein B0H64DRAFT_29587 [Chaetomium fimeti]
MCLAVNLICILVSSQHRSFLVNRTQDPTTGVSPPCCSAMFRSCPMRTSRVPCTSPPPLQMTLAGHPTSATETTPAMATGRSPFMRP